METGMIHAACASVGEVIYINGRSTAYIEVFSPETESVYTLPVKFEHNFVNFCPQLTAVNQELYIIKGQLFKLAEEED
jgi:hypothetical protein